MNKKLLLATIILASSGSYAASTATTHDAKALEKVSYAIGFEVAGQTPPGLNSDAFIKGYRAGSAKEKSAYTEQELKEAYTIFQNELQQKQAVIASEAAIAGQKFLSENAKKPKVITTASGLQYKINVAGKGKKPTADSTVKVHYKGQLLDGSVFDSSYERGEPVEFPLNQVIPGWTEGFQNLKEGSKATLYIPAKLAYGENGIPGTIPGNSTLIFDVELITVQ